METEKKKRQKKNSPNKTQLTKKRPMKKINKKDTLNKNNRGRNERKKSPKKIRDTEQRTGNTVKKRKIRRRRRLSRKEIEAIKKARLIKKIEKYLLILFTSLLLVNVVLILFTLKYNRAEVVGDSMKPTLFNKEKVLVAKSNTIQRFDVVTFQPPNGDKDKYVKRVIGLPGETISYIDGQLYINNSIVQDPIKNKTKDFSLYSITGLRVIPEDHYFVLGDNRSNSTDSRSFGLIERSDIEGTVQYIYEPWDKMGKVK